MLRVQVTGDARASPQASRDHAPMPADHRLGCDDVNGPSPVGPQLGEQHPEEAIDLAQPGPPGCLALEDGQLMPEGENLRLEVEAGPKSGPEGGDQGKQGRGHGGPERYQG